MSTKRGNLVRNRPQKYKNRTAFKNDLHDKTPKQKLINSIKVCEVCNRCKSVIEWKIKYKKYKPLTQPKTCIKCQMKNIRKAYHVLCKDCAIKDKVCAKCLKSGDEVQIELAEPTEQERQKLKAEMENLVKSLPERKRRAFLRYMKNGKQQYDTNEANSEPEENTTTTTDSNKKSDQEKSTTENLKEKNIRIPHTRDDLLKKIEELKVSADGEDDEEDNEGLDFDSDEGSDYIFYDSDE